MADFNRPGTAVCLHNQSLKTQKRSSAVLTCIKCLHGFFDGRFHQKSSNLAAGVFHKAGFKHLHKGTSKSFIKLQDHVPDKSLADNHICITSRNIPCFNTSNKIDPRAFLQKRERLFHKGISLLLLCTNVYNGNTRVLDSNHVFHIDGTHLRKLYQMLWSGIYVRTAVNKK